MKVAVTYDQGEIFQHFGRTAYFKLFTIEDQTIQSSEVVDTAGNGHGALADFLKQLGVDTVICGNIGPGAQETLNKAGIRFFGGLVGSVDQAVEDFLAGELKYNPDVCCKDHDHAHEGGHSCGSADGGHCHD